MVYLSEENSDGVDVDQFVQTNPSKISNTPALSALVRNIVLYAAVRFSVSIKCPPGVQQGRPGIRKNDMSYLYEVLITKT